jgi:hypothetical protein
MGRGTSRLYGLLAWAVAAGLVTPEVLQRMAADDCVDAGGSYDYALGVCDQIHGHRALLSWGPTMWLALAGGLLAAFGAWLLLRKGRRP